jgi:hypothetical protein
MSSTRTSATELPIQSNGRPGSKRRTVSFLEFITGRFEVKIIPTTPDVAAESKPGNKSSREDRPKRSKPLTWGIISALIGFIVLLVAVSLQEVFHPTRFSLTFGLHFLGHLGIASLLLGIVGITVELKNWTDYFEERLAYTIRKKEFLRTLQDKELEALLEEVFRAIYKVDNFDSDSFLNFFTTRMQDYIGGSFREKIARMITVHRSIDDVCRVEEDLDYKCRKIDSPSSTIQASVKFSADEFDMSNLDYKITLKPPRETQNFELRSKFPPCEEDGSYIFNKKDLDKLRDYVTDLSLPGKHHGFELSLKEFKDIDGLHVQVHLEYSIPTDRFFAWVMNYPSKEFEAVINFPDEEFEILVETFGMDDKDVTITKQTGAYKLKYDSWLLPENGLAYRFKKRRETSQSSIAAVVVEYIATEESASNDFLRNGDEDSPTFAEAIAANTAADELETDRSVQKRIDSSQLAIGPIPGKNTASDECEIKGPVRKELDPAEAVPGGDTAAGEFDDAIVKEGYHQFVGSKVDG